jgi:hypothetical protein
MEHRRTPLFPTLAAAFAFNGMITVNALANALPLNGVNTGQLSDELPNLFVPAGLTFSIWGLIYLLLAGHLLVLLEAALRPARTPDTDQAVLPRPGAAAIWLLAANFALNAAWIFAWHWRLLPLSVVIMLGILGTLVAIEELEHRRGEKAQEATSTGLRVRRFLLTQPLLVYLGWICVATVANVTALLVHLGFDGGGLDPRAWTVLAVFAATAVGGALVWRRGHAAPALVVMWALAGIILKRARTDAAETVVIIAAAALGASVLLGIVVWKGRPEKTALTN